MNTFARNTMHSKLAELSPSRVSRALTAHRLRHVLAILFLLVLPAAAQSPVAPSMQNGTVTDPNGVGRDPGGAGSEGVDAKLEARRIAALNEQRQKQMVSDADKLLQLAQELNDDADAGGTRLSHAERLRKAAEIEKLAKNVKDKMIYAIGPPTDVMAGPFAAWQR